MPTAARLLTTLIILVLAAHNHAHSDGVIIGRVVAVADGDTITVLENQNRHRIRLFGIDAPEIGQDFGNRARQFVADMVFGKQVRVAFSQLKRPLSKESL